MAILGTDFLRQMGAKIDLKENVIINETKIDIGGFNHANKLKN